MNTEGIGLGLNISKKIVNALGGEIALDKNYTNLRPNYIACKPLEPDNLLQLPPIRYDISHERIQYSQHMDSMRSFSNESLDLEGLMPRMHMQETPIRLLQELLNRY